MSLYSEYLEEKTNDLIIEWPEGFATYRYLNNDKTVYIMDIYVRPSFRINKIATKLADEIVAKAKANGATELLGSVVPSSKKSTLGLKVMLAYGMTLNSSANDLIIFKKEI